MMSYCVASGNFIGEDQHSAVIKNPYNWLKTNAEQTVKLNCRDDASF